MNFSQAILLCQFLFLLFHSTTGTILFAELTGGGNSPAINSTFKGLAIGYYSNVTRVLNITVMHNITSDEVVFGQVQYVNTSRSPPISSILFPFIKPISPTVMDGINVTVDQDKLLLSNNFYFLIQSIDHINGELRGTLRSNKFNGTVEYAGVQTLGKKESKKGESGFLGVTYFSYNCSGNQGRIRFVHNLNQSITIQIFGITNSSLHATPNNASSVNNKNKKSGKHLLIQRGNKNKGDKSNRNSATVLPSYVSLFNVTANASINVVNATVNFTATSLNFTTFIGGIIFMKVLDEKNKTILTGFLNQTDKDNCKIPPSVPLTLREKLVIVEFTVIIGLIVIFSLAKWWYSRRKRKDSKYEGVPTSTVTKV